MQMMNLMGKIAMLYGRSFSLISVLNMAFVTMSWADDRGVDEENDLALMENTIEEASPYEHEMLDENGDAMGVNDGHSDAELYSNQDDALNASPPDYPEMENDDTGDFYEPESPGSYNPEESI